MTKRTTTPSVAPRSEARMLTTLRSREYGPRMRRVCAATVMVLLGGVAAASPRPKLAALILKTGSVDEELADNLTEVLIARLARRGDHEIAGKEELKSKLGIDERAAAEC